MGSTSIEWTEHTVNPFRASLNGRTGHYCEKISEGCKNCYASTMQRRFGMPEYQDQRNSGVRHWLDPKALTSVMRRKAPTTFFWCSMTDMFGDWVPFEWIAACFGVMAATPDHTHQVLTKRPERAKEWFEWLSHPLDTIEACVHDALNTAYPSFSLDDASWPLRNVWIGTSVENQKAAQERIPHLLECPAAIRFLSMEPLLEEIDVSETLRATTTIHASVDVEGAIRNKWFDHIVSEAGATLSREQGEEKLRKLLADGVQCMPLGKVCDGFSDQTGCPGHKSPGIDWVIVGGESGHGARPMQLDWVRSIVSQCKDAGVAVFVKQLGKRPTIDERSMMPEQPDDADPLDVAAFSERFIRPLELTHGKGGDWSEWPEDLRIREMPEVHK